MSDFLYASPSFAAGMASVLDLGGGLFQFNESRNECEADNLALYNDFKAVGDDIRSSAQVILNEAK